MSSNYLTTSNMDLLERLLCEAPERMTDPPREIAAARMLVSAVEGGTDEEADLRSKLINYRLDYATADALVRWENAESRGPQDLSGEGGKAQYECQGQSG